MNRTEPEVERLSAPEDLLGARARLEACFGSERWLRTATARLEGYGKGRVGASVVRWRTASSNRGTYFGGERWLSTATAKLESSYG